jgi:hypothetical protein
MVAVRSTSDHPPLVDAAATGLVPRSAAYQVKPPVGAPFPARDTRPDEHLAPASRAVPPFASTLALVGRLGGVHYRITVVAWAAVPDVGARPPATSPSLSGATQLAVVPFRPCCVSIGGSRGDQLEGRVRGRAVIDRIGT